MRLIAGVEPTVPCSSTTLHSLSPTVVDQPLAGDAAFLDLVGGDRGQVQVLRRVDAAVEQDDRDLGFLGFGQHVIPAGGDDRRDEDRVDALGDEAADRLDLVFLLLLRVGELQVDAALFGLAAWSPWSRPRASRIPSRSAKSRRSARPRAPSKTAAVTMPATSASLFRIDIDFLP